MTRADLARRWRELRVAAGMIVSRTPPWPGFGEPFNGQDVRLRTVRGLIDRFDPDAFVETGTFLGFTTRFFAGNRVPVYTVEVDPKFYLAARVRLAWGGDVHVIKANSRDAVADLARKRPFNRPLAYLDAHWWDDLPLRDEVRSILGGWSEALIVIDDIQIPGDDGYGYDEHHGVALSLDLLDLPEGAVAAHPAGPSEQETGARRGTLYIGQGPDALAAIDTLVERGLLRLASTLATADA